MSNKCAFERCHPTVLLLWFSVVLAVTVASLDPIYAAMSFIAAALHKWLLLHCRIKPRSVIMWGIFIIFAALMNPLFSHHGVTVLFFLGGLPVTLESIYFGIMMSVTIAASLMWCSLLSVTITSDKLIYLFGKPFPKLAVLISLTLRFIPLYKNKFKEIYEVQCAAGRNADNIKDKIRLMLDVFLILISVIIEDSIDTAYSMKARGIELKGRTSYSDFSYSLSDIIITALTIPLSVRVLYAEIYGLTDFSFYPMITYPPVYEGTVVSYLCFSVIVMIPVVLEVIMWRRLRFLM